MGFLCLFLYTQNNRLPFSAIHTSCRDDKHFGGILLPQSRKWLSFHQAQCASPYWFTKRRWMLTVTSDSALSHVHGAWLIVAAGIMINSLWGLFQRFCKFFGGKKRVVCLQSLLTYFSTHLSLAWIPLHHLVYVCVPPYTLAPSSFPFEVSVSPYARSTLRTHKHLRHILHAHFFITTAVPGCTYNFTTAKGACSTQVCSISWRRQ